MSVQSVQLLDALDNPINAFFAGKVSHGNIIHCIGDGVTENWYTDWVSMKHSSEAMIVYLNGDGKFLQAVADDENIKVDVSIYGSCNKRHEFQVSSSFMANGKILDNSKSFVAYEDIQWNPGSSPHPMPYIRFKIVTQTDGGSAGNALSVGSTLEVRYVHWSNYGGRGSFV